MEEIRNRLLLIGFSLESVAEILDDLPDRDEQEAFAEWQEQLYREQCVKFVNEVMD